MSGALLTVAMLCLFFAGFLGGRITTRRSLERKPPKFVCSCGHGFGMHENGRSCAAHVSRKRWNSYGEHTGYTWCVCPCLTYDGPEPPPRVWSMDFPS